MGWLLLLTLTLSTAVGAQSYDPASDQGADLPPGQVLLDDVWCTVCHYEQGDEFALSVHYQRGLLLCNDCHGGDPFQDRSEQAKAPDTGFIGKPARADIAKICARCHSGPARFFAMGPHASPANLDNPTCITCHQNHLVIDATLAVMDTTCAICHPGDAGVLRRAEAIQAALHTADDGLHAVQVRFDSLQRIDAGLRRSSGLLAGAGGVLRQIEPQTHALDMDLIAASITEFDNELDVVQDMLDASESWRERRLWIVLGVWAFVAANVGLLWWKRRQL
jgi:hypothetical protein